MSTAAAPDVPNPKLERWTRIARRLVPTESQRLLLLTVLIGCACGLVAVLFHVAIGWLSAHTVEWALGRTGAARVGWTLAIPTLGALLSGWVLYRFVPLARGSGIPQVKVAYARRGARLRLRDSIGKLFVATVQVGTGSSLGREGPTVQICAGVAASLGRLFGVSPQNQRRLIPVGAAAGIAAAFNAPIAAVTFTIEEIVGALDQTVLSGVIVAAAVAAVVERSVLGVHPLLPFNEPPDGFRASSLTLYAALGVLAALVAVTFHDALLSVRNWYRARRALPDWLAPATGALATAVLALVAWYALGSSGVTGGGYVSLSKALAGTLPVRVLIGLCVLKVIATTLSYSSGGAGGVFAPALFIGAMLGGAMGMLDERVFDHAASTRGAFALVGMGAVFAGLIRAPMTSVLIIIEMTSGYSLALPLMIANMTAYGLARALRPEGLYEALLRQDGITLEQHASGRVDVELAALVDAHRDFSVLQPGMSGRSMLERASGSAAQQVFPVLDADERLVGLVTLDDVTFLAAETELDLVVTVSDVMHPPVALRAEDDLRTAFEAMIANDMRELPVVDATGRVLGLIDEPRIARAYIRGRSDSAPHHA
jgi:CIC family chloride channel protein